MDIAKELEKRVDEKYKKFQEKLCPGTNDILGVRLPELRSLAKEIAKNEPYLILDKDKVISYEEKMLYGMTIGYAKLSLDERIKYLKRFIPMIDNWAICDCCVSSMKFIPKEENHKKIKEFLKPYLKSQEEFYIRFAVIVLMDYYLGPNDIDETLKIYDNIRTDKYYVQMAIAWAISSSYIKDCKKTEEFIKNSKLDDFTINKAIQKIRESYRVNKEEKEQLLAYKRKSK